MAESFQESCGNLIIPDERKGKIMLWKSDISIPFHSLLKVRKSILFCSGTYYGIGNEKIDPMWINL